MKRLLALVLLFLRPAGLDFASGVAGALGGFRGLANARRLPNSDLYVPQHAAEADSRWFAAMEAIKAATDRNTGMVDPVLLQSFSSMLGIDLSQLAQAGFAAGEQFGQAADTAGYYGDTMGARGAEAFGRADSIWREAQDPQQALYNRSKHNIVEGARAADSARGIAMGGVSAGNENQAVRDFEIDWNNQQLARQLAGSAGANQAGALGGANLTSSMGYYGMQPGLEMQSAFAPIQAQQTQYQLPMDWATMFSQAQAANVQGPQSQVAAGYYPYMGMAAGIGSQEFANDMQSSLARNAMQQQSYYGIAGGGQSGGGNPYGSWAGNQSGFGNPMNWMGMGGAGGGAGSGAPAGMGTGMTNGTGWDSIAASGWYGW